MEFLNLKKNTNAHIHAVCLYEELCKMIKDYLNCESDLTYEQVCKLLDLRRALEVHGVFKGEGM